MASYEEDHNIPPPLINSTAQASSRPHLDLDEFFSSLDRTTSSMSHDAGILNTNTDAHAFRSLARAFQSLEHTPVMQTLISRLLEEAEGGDVKAKGVPEGFLDQLERVEKKKLKKEDVCCICNSPFLDDPYPLVVRLPCHVAHIFDLECIAPWLKLHQTCPLDRKELVKKPLPLVADDSEEEWDPNYG